jgi:hypothetical protein
MIRPAPKPAPRARKAPKPIARKRAKPRTVKTSCVVRACKRAPVHIKRCGSHADEYLLKLRRALVVKNFCELADWHQSFMPRCSGPICDNHGLDRGYTRGNLRWDPANGFSGCAGVNYWVKYHPLEWHDYLRRRWGQDKYDARVQLALHGPKADYEKALADLSGQKEAAA